MKKLNEIVETLKLVGLNLYWLKACQKVYGLTNGEMGYIVSRIHKPL